ncbi:hypothetical protein GCM10007382_10830 [Salinibacterium xinjiangense]|uniref:ArsR family transcriptional regulator n=2 Tax=Salinibacterium xinjiangense TaxID=386302 RepID=A0A2C8Z6N6_9MICO|nr:hypothetical protein GCM10007382_10830 [Salinibacterium xinjiangense]SOE59497.1 ArsR family transcriptional regulator [Salinibacterium xinjiangense]
MHPDVARPHVDCPDVLLEQCAGRGIRQLSLDFATHRLRSMDVYAATSIELKLLTDPTRARILHLIMESLEGRRSVSDLAGELQLRQPTVSHHLKALVEVGLLERNPDGRLVWYSIQPEHADRVAEVLQRSPATGSAEGVLERVTADLSGRFAGVFSPETVARYVQESYTLLAENGKAIRYLPSLASRFAADRLSALAKVESNDLDRTPEVLFVCVQNAGRSQMAAGILRHLAGDTVRVRTAGSDPASTVRSVIVAALDEIGVSIGGEFPKPLTDEVVRAADVVITMGCGDACPIYPGRRYLDWDVGDPVGLPIGRVRDIRDDIEARVRSLLATLQVNAV